MRDQVLKFSNLLCGNQVPKISIGHRRHLFPA